MMRWHDGARGQRQAGCYLPISCYEIIVSIVGNTSARALAECVEVISGFVANKAENCIGVALVEDTQRMEHFVEGGTT